MRMLTKFWATLLFALLAAERPAPAQPNYLEPGSLLVYPLVDSRMGIGRGTVISVTNTNGNRVIDPVTGYRRGTTQVRFYYVTLSGTGWQLTDIPELLTPRDILTGFLSPDEKLSYGRPVGVALGPDGSLLVADDVGDAIWRVTGA